ncbi:hypothetical protein [Chryseobacterium taichungense]|uniref:hypothetical protein n=1 Tax=Chryseobacterium taichungense TaxID=295069 RepID=UPI0028A94CA9|nr:hypothetical protein [Chryseobacterium taichungense]
MKIIMNKFSLLPLFLRSYVRMLCCQLLFVSVFISSKTPSLQGDSAIFISGDAYMYADRQATVAVTISEGKEFSTRTQHTNRQPKIVKSSSKAVHTSECISGKRQLPIHFTVPGDSQQLSTAGSISPKAVRQDFSSRKLLHHMKSPAFPQPQVMISNKKKSLGNAIYPFKISHITTHQFSRPPPILQSSLMILSTSATNYLTQISTNIYAQMTQML